MYHLYWWRSFALSTSAARNYLSFLHQPWEIKHLRIFTWAQKPAWPKAQPSLTPNMSTRRDLWVRNLHWGLQHEVLRKVTEAYSLPVSSVWVCFRLLLLPIYLLLSNCRAPIIYQPFDDARDALRNKLALEPLGGQVLVASEFCPNNPHPLPTQYSRCSLPAAFTWLGDLADLL